MKMLTKEESGHFDNVNIKIVRLIKQNKIILNDKIDSADS